MFSNEILIINSAIVSLIEFFGEVINNSRADIIIATLGTELGLSFLGGPGSIC